MNKQQRYQKKMVASGRCPHCGKPCAPYYECEDRRSYRKSNLALRRMVNSSNINTVSCKTSTDDRRNLPRIGKKYANVHKIMVDIFKTSDQPLHKDEIYNLVMEKISELKKPVADISSTTENLVVKESLITEKGE